MLRQIMSLLFFFTIFPAFMDGLKCGFGGICYGSTDVATPFALEKKDCPDACISFKCFVDAGEIMEGAGCYEDFLNTCKYTRTEIKDQIKKNINNFAVREYDIYFTSCNDADGCATNGFDPWAIVNSTDKIFGKSFEVEEDLSCNYDNEPLKSLTTVKCSSMMNCESGKEYQNDKYSNPVYGPNKTCDACIKFACTLDGKTVTSGYGCYHDFEEACKFLGDDVKGKIQQNIKNSFYFDKNYIVFSCSDSDNCQIWSDSLFYYHRVNKIPQDTLNVNKNFYKICDKKIKPTSPPPITVTTTSQIETTTSVATTTTAEEKKDEANAFNVFSTAINSPSSGAANGQFDAFKLQKIITTFGFILICLWC